MSCMSLEVRRHFYAYEIDEIGGGGVGGGVISPSWGPIELDSDCRLI